MRSKLIAWAIAVVSGLGTGISTSAEEWSRFRGPNGSGVADAGPLPLRFGPGENLVWKTPLPPGHSSPVLTEDGVFLTAARGETLLTLRLDRSTGRILWEREAPRDRFDPVDRRNSPASPSPVTDGEAVYVFFPDFGVLSYELDGRERWRVPLGPFDNIYGMGASPILVGDLVVLACDQNRDSFLIAIDKRDGRVRWRTPRPEAKSGHSTPVVYQADDGREQIVVPGSFYLTAYAAENGEKIWWAKGLSFEMKSTPVLYEGTAFIHGYGFPENQPESLIEVSTVEEAFVRDANGDGSLSLDELPDEKSRARIAFIDLDGNAAVSPGEWTYYRDAMETRNGLLAIRLGGRGDVTESAVRWTYHKAIPQLPSPLVYGGILYMVDDAGRATSLDASSGKVIEQGRLEGAIDRFYASPVAADGKVFLVSESGKVAVLREGGSLSVMAVNDLGENCYATPAISGNRLYIRTSEALYAFGSPASVTH
jgi:outer membrane protein assembly factor BamB